MAITTGASVNGVRHCCAGSGNMEFRDVPAPGTSLRTYQLSGDGVRILDQL
jgi:hypothetical protein